MALGRHARGVAPLRRWSPVGLLAAMLAAGNGTVARADEACLSAPTPACIVDFYAAGADLPLHAVRALPTAEFAVTRVITALLALEEIDIAEAVARRELSASAGARLQDRASPIAVARFLASVRAGAPEFAWLDGLGDPAGVLAPLYGASTAASDPAVRPWFAYLQVGYALRADLAERHGVASVDEVPSAARAGFRRTPAWQGIDAGLLRWAEMSARPFDKWGPLARFRAALDDVTGARDVLARMANSPANGTEIQTWWRLGDAGTAEARARASGNAGVLAAYAELAIGASIAAGDQPETERLMAEAWPRALERRSYGSADMSHARRLVRMTAAAGARAEARSRAEALRNVVRSVGPRENETYWIEAAAALNDIGEHAAALALLHEELGWRPDSRAAGCAIRADRLSPVVRRGVWDPHALAVEFVRAGAAEPAQCVLSSLPLQPAMALSRGQERRLSEAFLQHLGMPSEGARSIVRQETLSRDVDWLSPSRPGAVPQWRSAIIGAADDLRQTDVIFAFLASQPVTARIGPLLLAAREAARRGHAEWATARLTDVLALIPELQRPFLEACGLMQTARRLRREDIADAAFHLAVGATRGEPLAIRGAILVDLAACRAGRIPAD